MTTLKTPRPEDFSPEDWTILERTAKRMGQKPEQLLTSSIFGVQTHWPAWLEANADQARHSYQLQGKLPRITKEAMHVAVSMTNPCTY